jgi:hypothetical protein
MGQTRQPNLALNPTALLSFAVSMMLWHCSPAPVQRPRTLEPQSMQARYEGTLELEGDFRRPGETRSYNLEQRFRRWPDGRVQAEHSRCAVGTARGTKVA